MAEVAPRDRTYIGIRDNGPGSARVFVEHGDDLDPRFDLRNHSPDGFEWGYYGSGPAQLALALLCNVLGGDKSAAFLALKLYQDFKAEKIAELKDNRWRMSAGEIRDWIKSKAPPCFRWADEETVQ